MQHRLAQLLFAVQTFHKIGLVDDIDQMNRFGDPPEHLVETDLDFPIVLQEPVFEFAHVKMGAPVIAQVEAGERFGDKPFVAVIPEGLCGQFAGNRDILVLLG